MAELYPEKQHKSKKIVIQEVKEDDDSCNNGTAAKQAGEFLRARLWSISAAMIYRCDDYKQGTMNSPLKNIKSSVQPYSTHHEHLLFLLGQSTELGL